MFLDKILTLIIVHILVLVVPGPNSALVIRNTIRFGCKAGVISAIGVTLAITFHSVFATLATTGLINQLHHYFFYIKTLGVLYVFGFGLKLIWSGLSNQSQSNESQSVELTNDQKPSPFKSAFFLDLFNPYVSLFYICLSPSILENIDSVIAIPLFTFVVVLINLIWFSSLAFLISTGHSKTKMKLKALII